MTSIKLTVKKLPISNRIYFPDSRKTSEKSNYLTATPLEKNILVSNGRASDSKIKTKQEALHQTLQTLRTSSMFSNLSLAQTKPLPLLLSTIATPDVIHDRKNV